MTSYLVDINVWLALSWLGHPGSKTASAWLAALPKSRTKLHLCRITQLGLLRLLTNNKLMGGSVLTTREALRVIDLWSEDPRVELVPEPNGIEFAFRQSLEGFRSRAATKVIMDAYLVAFALVDKSTLVSFDKGICKLAAHMNAAHILLSGK